MSLTWISTNVASTETGSTAEISEANTNSDRASNLSLFSPYRDVKLKAHRVSPVSRTLKIVLKMANRRMVPMLLKKGRLGMKYPASKMIGGNR